MKVSRYLCRVVGESYDRAVHFHPATVRRMTVFALAIHLPVLLWTVQSFLIARCIFGASEAIAGVVAGVCGFIIYLLERLVVGTPNSRAVGGLRVLIGVVVALLGSSAVDLMLFDREISHQLRVEGERLLIQTHSQRVKQLDAEVERLRQEWLRAQAAASCEADGTCGSKVRSTGPVYRELARQAERLRGDFDQARMKAASQRDADRAELRAWKASLRVLEEAGLLQRLQALYDYIDGNPMARWVWALTLFFVVAIELVVIFTKFAFGQTVDDHIDLVRESVARHQADSYLEAMTSPYAGARQALRLMRE
jgi:hypothetical protein